MSQFVGYVQEISTRSGTSGNGKPYTAYNVKFLTPEGQDQYVGWGFNAPSFQEGVWIQTTLEQNGKYLNYKGAPVEIKAGGAPAASVAAPTASSSSSDSAFIVDRQSSIIYQSSRKDAIEVCGLLLAHDALPVSTAKGKAGESKRFEQVQDFVNKLTVQFFHDVDTLRLLESVADAGDVELTARGEQPEEVEVPAETEDAFGEEPAEGNPFA